MVTADVPLEVRVTDFETAVPTATFPNASEVELRVRPGTAAFSCNAKLFEEAFALAVSVTVCELLTEFTLALNDAVVAPDATVMLLGTATALLPLATATLRPPLGAAAVSDTVQAVDPEPVKELVPHESAPIDAVSGAELEVVGLTLIEVDLELDPWLAVNLALCRDDTADAFAENDTLAVPAGIVTDAGTVTTLLLLAMLTTIPPLDATADNVTVQLSIAGPMIVGLMQLNPEIEGVELAPFP